MKTLVVYYSKTGNTKKVAEAAIKELGCDFDEIGFDDKGQKITVTIDPAEYERVILLAPIWAFSLCVPMQIYVNRHKDAIKKYSLVVTCILGFGVSSCIKCCLKAIGRKPEKTFMLKAKLIKEGKFDIKEVL